MGKATLMDLLSIEDPARAAPMTKHAFVTLLTNLEAAKALDKVGVDTVGLVDCADYVFKDKPEMSFVDLLELMLNLRGGSTAKVKDLVDVRKFLVAELAHLQHLIEQNIRPSASVSAVPAHSSKKSQVHAPAS